jgi:hypothetical protein
MEIDRREIATLGAAERLALLGDAEPEIGPCLKLVRQGCCTVARGERSSKPCRCVQTIFGFRFLDDFWMVAVDQPASLKTITVLCDPRCAAERNVMWAVRDTGALLGVERLDADEGCVPVAVLDATLLVAPGADPLQPGMTLALDAIRRFSRSRS